MRDARDGSPGNGHAHPAAADSHGDARPSNGNAYSETHPGATHGNANRVTYPPAPDALRDR